MAGPPRVLADLFLASCDPGEGGCNSPERCLQHRLDALEKEHVVADGSRTLVENSQIQRKGLRCAQSAIWSSLVSANFKYLQSLAMDFTAEGRASFQEWLVAKPSSLRSTRLGRLMISYHPPRIALPIIALQSSGTERSRPRDLNRTFVDWLISSRLAGTDHGGGGR